MFGKSHKYLRYCNWGSAYKH